MIGAAGQRRGRTVHEYGLGPQRRLRRSEDFEALLRGGLRRSAGGYTFYFRNRSSGLARLGLLVSRRHAPRSTDRNRIKRCIREAFRLEQGALGPMDVLVRPPYGVKTGAAMIASLRELLRELAE